MKIAVVLFSILITLFFIMYIMVSGRPVTSVLWENSSSLIAFVSLCGMLISYQTQQEWRNKEQEKAKSETYSKHAILSIERAYNVITNNGTRDGPEKNRLEWLTCARWLSVSSRLASKISVPSLQEIFEDEQEYWRNQFYDFFKPHDIHNFACNINNFNETERGAGDALEKRSVTVIYKFVQWPENRADPIDEHEPYTQDEIDGMVFSKRAIREYFGGDPLR